MFNQRLTPAEQRCIAKWDEGTAALEASWPSAAPSATPSSTTAWASAGKQESLV
jgi:hypothetical protein